MLRNRIILFVSSFLIVGLFFVALPEKGYSGIVTMGCCEFQTSCDDLSAPVCRREGGLFFEGEFCNDATGQCIR